MFFFSLQCHKAAFMPIKKMKSHELESKPNKKLQLQSEILTVGREDVKVCMTLKKAQMCYLVDYIISLR